VGGEKGCCSAVAVSTTVTGTFATRSTSNATWWEYEPIMDQYSRFSVSRWSKENTVVYRAGEDEEERSC
jgi:hypothetical protein